MTADNAFTDLATFDPELARRLTAARHREAAPLPEAVLGEMAETILAAFEQAFHLGQAVAEAYGELMVDATPSEMTAFRRQIRMAARQGAALGQHLARVLPTLLRTRDKHLLDTFDRTLAILLAKGDYLVKAPLAPLPALAAGDPAAAADYLRLLQVVFDRPLSYNRCQYLGNLLPRAVGEVPPTRRTAWIRQMTRLVEEDLGFIEPFLEGLPRGLELLSSDALHRFVDLVLEEASRNPGAARRFLALQAGRGREVCGTLQTAATLEQHRGRLNRYITARIGRPVAIRPLSSLDGGASPATEDLLRSGTDGRLLYLPDTVDPWADPQENARLLGAMAKFETGLLEFDTFTFDLERARDLGCLEAAGTDRDFTPQPALSDFSVFSRQFSDPRLALDLLTLFEHARIQVRLAQAYPGMVKSRLPLYQKALLARFDAGGKGHLLDVCYGMLALHVPLERMMAEEAPGRRFVESLAATFAACGPASMRVEHCARLVLTVYDRFQTIVAGDELATARLAPPYRMALQLDLIEDAERKIRRQADHLMAALASRGPTPYRGDLRHLLLRSDGKPRPADILNLPDREGCAGTSCRPQTVSPGPPTDGVLRGEVLVEETAAPDDVDRVTWFREWSAGIGDYLHDHVRVRDRRLVGGRSSFYADVLERCAGLVRRMRRSFELLRPEGLGLLRQWVEGDDFDYRALLDFALDRKAGRQPSDRLYIKRMKQRRDVAVMLLVDLSRSTSNIVKGSSRSVLDVAKEAVVLFTQALEVVGDAYAVAGYSGTGRLGVDFFRIKDFNEPLGDAVRGALSALTPQRSTRMGAAVRRATRELAACDNRVRLLLMIGDGFPNDTDYKGDYAVQDTRQAIAEARSSGVVTQAITVNLPASPRLDALFGPVRHTVISQVEELPDKLLRLYGALTR